MCLHSCNLESKVSWFCSNIYRSWSREWAYQYLCLSVTSSGLTRMPGMCDESIIARYRDKEMQTTPGSAQSSRSDTDTRQRRVNWILFPLNKTFLADNIALFILTRWKNYHGGVTQKCEQRFLFVTLTPSPARSGGWSFEKLTLSWVEFPSWILIQFLARKCQENWIKSFEFQILQDLFN